MERIKKELNEIRVLTQNIPSITVSLFIAAIILMNLLANKEVPTGLDWLPLDGGFFLSWLAFMCMDMIAKHFGAKAAIGISIIAAFCNVVISVALFLITKLPGNWSAYYDYMDENVNAALDSTFGGLWFVLLGSMAAFISSAIVNALINQTIGNKMKKDNYASFAARSYISTMIAQFVDNFVFALIVSHNFFGWTLLQCVTCAFTGAIAELLCEIVFSPIGYKACKRWKEEGVGKAYFELIGKESV